MQTHNKTAKRRRNGVSAASSLGGEDMTSISGACGRAGTDTSPCGSGEALQALEPEGPSVSRPWEQQLRPRCAGSGRNPCPSVTLARGEHVKVHQGSATRFDSTSPVSTPMWFEL